MECRGKSFTVDVTEMGTTVSREYCRTRIGTRYRLHYDARNRWPPIMGPPVRRRDREQTAGEKNKENQRSVGDTEYTPPLHPPPWFRRAMAGGCASS